MMDNLLLKKLRCPQTGAELIFVADTLISKDVHTRYRYKVQEGIPVLLKEGAEVVSESEWKELMQKNLPR